MKKFIQTLVLLLFTFFVGGLTEYMFSTDVEDIVAVSDSSVCKTYSGNENTHSFSDVELGEFTQSQNRVNYSRVQRTVSSEHNTFFKLLIKTMAAHTTTLVQHWNRTCNSLINESSSLSGKYYVFAFRHIII